MSQIRKIMVPLDGSELAEKPLASAAVLARALGASLLLIRVQESVAHFADQALHEQVAKFRESEIHRYLEKVAQADELADVSREVLTVSGPVADSILDVVSDYDVDLIMMSSHGRSGIGLWVYGSIAAKVLRHAPCPTIILQAKADIPMFSHQQILVPLDGSALAEQALDYAMMIAQVTGSELILLRVTGITQLAIDSVDPLVMKQDLDKIEERELLEAREYLESVQQRLAGSGMAVNIEVLSGPVAETILAFTARNEVDLITMSSHGRSGVSRWFYGSVARKVLNNSHCAMLIIRGENH